MAVLKQIKFGEVAHDIAKTVVNGTGVVSVTNTKDFSNEKTEGKDYSYDIDVNVDNSTIVKSDGKLTVGTVPAVQVSVDNTAAGITSTNAQAAFKELKDDIKKVISDGKTYSIVDDTKNVESLPTNVLKRYRLQETDGSTNNLLGEPIDIYKDSSLKSVALVGQTLKFTYILADGSESTVGVDVSTFLAESEFGDGLQLTDHVISVKLGQGLEFGSETSENKSIKVKIDSTSSDAEKFLSVGANGVKISGVQAAIDAKVATLDVTDDKTIEGQYVAAIQETDGIVSVKERANVSEAVLKNYAKGSAPVAGSEAVAASDTINKAISKLEHQVDAAKAATTAAIEALDKKDTAGEGKVVTAVPTTNGIAQPTKADFADIKLGGFVQDASATGEIASTDTLAAALNKLENAIDEASAEHSVVEKDSDAAHLIVNPSTAENGKTTYIIGENNIASASDLTAEANRAKSAEISIDTAIGLTKAADGETRTYTNEGNYIGKAETKTVASDIKALDTQLKNVTDKLAAVQYKVSGTTLEFFGISESKTV